MHKTSSSTVDIVGIGVSVWDRVLLIDSFPRPGSVVQARQQIEGVGGGITVATATAARLGSRTAMIDCLGDDPAALQIIHALQNEGVDTSLIARQQAQTSSIASIWAESSAAERTIVFYPGSAGPMLRWTSAMEELIGGAKILHFNGRHPDVCATAIGVAKSCGVTLSFDGGAYRYREEVLPAMRASDIVIVARQFAQSHYRRCVGSSDDISNADLAKFLMADLRCQMVGVTDGEAGSDLIERSGTCFHQPAIGVSQAIDTTGCGDTYHGAFLHSIARGGTVKESAKLAAAVSSANARRLGGLAFELPVGQLPAHDHV